jgi:hypothetical protein
MNTQPNRITNSTVVSPAATPAAARKGWFSLYWKWLTPTALIAFVALPLAPLGSVYAAPPAAEQAGVIQTQETNAEGVVGELTDCRRSEGVLTIKVRFRNTSNKPEHLTFINWNASGADNPKFYVTAGNKKYFMLADADGTVLSTNSTGASVEANLAPGKTYLWWAKYPAPPTDVKKINFMMPVASPFEDVPITDK